MILAVLLILYVAIGLMIESVLNVFFGRGWRTHVHVYSIIMAFAYYCRRYWTNYVAICYSWRQNWRVSKEEI